MLENSAIKVLTTKEGSKIIKILWIIVLSSSLFGLGFYIKVCYSKLKISPEILVNEEYIHSYTIPFPAITICPPIYIKSEFLNISKLHDDLLNNRTIKDEDTMLIPSSIHTCANNDKQSIIDLQLKVLKTKKFDEKVIENMNKAAPSITDSFVKCEVNEFNGCENIFIRTYTDFGYCFTFNLMGYNSLFNDDIIISSDFEAYKRKKIVKNWSNDAEIEYHEDDLENPEESTTWTLEEGYPVGSELVQPLRSTKLQYLLVRMKVNRSDASNICTGPFDLYRVLFHLPNEIPTMMHSYTVTEIESMKLTRINANVKNIGASLKSFAPAKRGCFLINEKHLRFFKAYTKYNCEYECMTNFTLLKCGCVKHSMPRTENEKVCQVEDVKCYSEISKNWPTSYYKDNRVRKVENLLNLPCSCLPPCTQIKYNIISEHARDLRGASTQTHIFSGLRMLFINSQIIRTTNYVTYGIQNFIADVGGLAGLFLGFSLLSLFELIIEFFMFIKGLNKHRKVHANKNQKLNDSQTNKNKELVVEIPNFDATKFFDDLKQPEKYKAIQNVSTISSVKKVLRNEKKTIFDKNPFEISENSE